MKKENESVLALKMAADDVSMRLLWLLVLATGCNAFPGPGSKNSFSVFTCLLLFFVVVDVAVIVVFYFFSFPLP